MAAQHAALAPLIPTASSSSSSSAAPRVVAASPGGQLPTYWLVLQQLSAFPSNVTWGLATSILLPVSVSTIVCPHATQCTDSETAAKASKLATAAFCGAVAQLSQPFWGALSDRLRPSSRYWGRRRVVVAAAQVSTVVALLGMAVATNQTEMSVSARFWLLTAAYTSFQVANSMFSAPYYSIIPELVPLHQRGSAGGWVAFLQASAGIASGGIATLQGNGVISSAQVYWLLISLNVIGLVNGVAAFSAQPGWCEPEAPPPAGGSAAAAADGKAGSGSPSGCAGACSFLGAFRHMPFAAMFSYCLLQGLPSGVTIYFLQYFLQDVIGQHGYDFSLFGYRYDSTKSAESATALVNIATSWCQLITSLIGGYASDRVGVKPVLVFSQILSALSIGSLGLVSSFTSVVLVAACLGLANGIGAGTVQPLQAFALPDNDSAAQDMNILGSAFTIAQIFAPIGCGVILAALVTTGGGGNGEGIASSGAGSEAAGSEGSGSVHAYRTIFLLAAAVQIIALPLLLLVRERSDKAVLAENAQRQREYTERLLSMSGRSRTTLARPRKGSLALLQSVDAEFGRSDISQLADRIPAKTTHIFRAQSQLSSSAGRVE
jgi:MFS family permease